MDLNRRFAEGYKLLMHKYGQERPAELGELETRLRTYQRTLASLGLRDYQVCALGWWSGGEVVLGLCACVSLGVEEGGGLVWWGGGRSGGAEPRAARTQVPTLQQDDVWKLVYTMSHLLLVWTLAMLPTLVLNAPVGLIARVVSAKEQKKALAASRVKIEAKDVIMCVAAACGPGRVVLVSGHHNRGRRTPRSRTPCRASQPPLRAAPPNRPPGPRRSRCPSCWCPRCGSCTPSCC
jgi:hypothetical protein